VAELACSASNKFGGRKRKRGPKLKEARLYRCRDSEQMHVPGVQLRVVALFMTGPNERAKAGISGATGPPTLGGTRRRLAPVPLWHMRPPKGNPVPPNGGHPEAKWLDLPRRASAVLNPTSGVAKTRVSQPDSAEGLLHSDSDPAPVGGLYIRKWLDRKIRSDVVPFNRFNSTRQAPPAGPSVFFRHR